MRITTLAILVLCATAPIGGCTERESFHLIAFAGSDETDAAFAAAESWCLATNGIYCPTFGSKKTNTISISASIPASPDAAGVTHITTSIRALNGEAHISILDRRSHPDWLQLLRQNVAHEMGHSAGCRRELAPGNIMYSNEADQPIDPTAEDIACALD